MLFRSTIFPSDPNLDAMRPLRLHSCLRREPFYCDQRIMPKIEAALHEADPKKSLALRREIMAWYADEAPSLFIYEGMRFIGTTARVSGYDEANGMIAFEKIEIRLNGREIESARPESRRGQVRD